HEKCNPLTQPGSGRGENAGDLSARKTERRGGMPELRGGSDSALRGSAAGSSDELLIQRVFISQLPDCKQAFLQTLVQQRTTNSEHRIKRCIISRSKFEVRCSLFDVFTPH